MSAVLSLKEALSRFESAESSLSSDEIATVSSVKAALSTNAHIKGDDRGTYDRISDEEHRRMFSDLIEARIAYLADGEGQKHQSEVVNAAEIWLAQLKAHQNMLKESTDQVDNLFQVLQHIQTLFESVSNNTNEVRNSCKKLTHEKESLLAEADELKEALSYFQDEGVLAHRLALQDRHLSEHEWQSILARLDHCIQYMFSHPDYRESRLYLARFKALRKTALKKMVTLVESSLQKASAAAANASSTKSLVEFRACVTSLHPIVTLIEERAEDNLEYKEALRQCQQLYYTARYELVYSGTESHLASLASSSSLPEFDLFPSSAVSDNTSTLMLLIGSMCSVFYMHMRSLVIHEGDIDCLCDVVNVLSLEILQDQVLPRGEEMEPIVPALERTIQDVQERLAYRAQTFVRDEISVFEPSEPDLDYPKKLFKKFSEEDDLEEEEESASPYSLWYPTLEKTLLFLSKLYQCLQTHVFEYIAQDAVSSCLQSLQNAAKSISINSSQTDGNLFLIKHMLILREQLSPFDAQFAVAENILDFSHLTGAFQDVLTGSGSLLAFLAPHVLRKEVDSKKDLDLELKRTCEVFINQATSSLVGPLVSFLSKAPKSPEDEVHPPFDIAESTKDMILTVSSATSESLESAFQSLLENLALYLDNAATEQFVLQPIQANVIHAIDELHSFVQTTFPDDASLDIQPLLEMKTFIKTPRE